MKIDRDNLLEHLLATQLGIIGKTIFQALTTFDWRTWEIDEKDFHLFKKYSIGVIQKTLKIPKKKALEQFEWFVEKYGLTIKIQ